MVMLHLPSNVRWRTWQKRCDRSFPENKPRGWVILWSDGSACSVVGISGLEPAACPGHPSKYLQNTCISSSLCRGIPMRCPRVPLFELKYEDGDQCPPKGLLVFHRHSRGMVRPWFQTNHGQCTKQAAVCSLANAAKQCTERRCLDPS